ncbi:CpaF/VirB11 family protein [Dactylosporangium sp. AC04546]|uniref:CpaF/VirB11 family protein n=1 Tax=Dactylosporangium sp. AC04546 TaxID=2862460 RepID=UPI001EDEA871|nr:CpaF/VirB11 family protein [Dactylosporangium sp. AC04546]WVK80413.1 CpaF/VirB11 family protein [Dactylosporangium sp. AC04546]
MQTSERPKWRSSGTGSPIARNDEQFEAPDYTVVRELQVAVSDELSRALAGRAYLSPRDLDTESRHIAAQRVRDYVDRRTMTGSPLGPDYERRLLDAVLAALLGLGRLERLLREPFDTITVLGCDGVRIERPDGRIDLADPIADSDEDLVLMLQALARRAGGTERALTKDKPTLSMELPTGQRLAATYLVTPRPVAVIRNHQILSVDLDELIDLDRTDPNKTAMIDPLLRDFLRAAMRAGFNIMVAGVPGSGKTSLLRALASEIPADEWFVVLEEARELGLHKTGRHPWAVSMEAREGHGERGPDGRPAGEITLDDLIPLSLQLNARHIIVGEVKSREIVAMLQAMGTTNGSLCTIHAREPGLVFDRVVELALSHRQEHSDRRAHLQVANALDLVVYVTMVDESAIGGRRHRFVSHVVEVGGLTETGRPRTTHIFGPGPDGRAVPLHQPDRLKQQLLLAGYDPIVLITPRGRGAWPRPLPRLRSHI